MKMYETITAENWCKEKMFDRDSGRACLHGHLSNVYIGKDAWIEPAIRLFDAIGILFPDRRSGGLIGFNDHPETDIEDVLRACKLADV